MEARASAKYLPGSPHKARLVIDLIRGKNVNDALAILRFSNKRAASRIEKCVRSAISNANEAAEKSNVAIDADDLWVKAAFVDMGPTKFRRRMRPAPQGRAYRERRHFCHVTVLLSSDNKKEEVSEKPKARRAESPKPSATKTSGRKRAAVPRPKRTAAASKKESPKKKEAPETKEKSGKSGKSTETSE